MCIYNRYTYNQQKFVSLLHSERLMVGIPCGHCVECETRKRNEYYFRSMYEFRSCVASGGYALFDCLTYDENNVPRVEDFFPGVPKELSFRCFSHEDFRLFFVRLRRYLTKKGYNVKDNLKYFLSSEYGTKKGRTHRPHYHILFYVYNNFIEPKVLSLAISKCWSYGRTDGIKYKGARYLYEECVLKSSLASSIRVSKYVSKYVQKSCTFRKEIEKRVSRLVWLLYSTKYLDVRVNWRLYRNMMDKSIRELVPDVQIEYEKFYNWMKSPSGRLVIQGVRRVLDQFHRQSQGFGISALDDMKYEDLVATGQLKIVDNSSRFVMFIPLPIYYKRKLFYKKVSFLGVQSWELNEKGIKFYQDREPYILRHIANTLQNRCLSVGDNTPYDFDALARYSYFQRGRLRASFMNVPTLSVKSHYKDTSYLLYSYTTPSDFQHYKIRFLSPSYLGNCNDGYKPITEDTVILFDEFVRRVCWYTELDSILDKIDGYTKEHKQVVAEHTERVTDKLRFIGVIPD